MNNYLSCAVESVVLIIQWNTVSLVIKIANACVSIRLFYYTWPYMRKEMSKTNENLDQVRAALC